MLINLPTGKTISVSSFEFYFILKEDEVDLFFQSCMADDLGEEIYNPFSRMQTGRIELVEDEEEEED